MNLFQKIINVGLFNNTSSIERKRIMILNYCSVICTITSVFFFIFDFSTNELDFKRGISFCIQVLIYIIIFLLQRFKKYTTARFLFILLLYVSLFYNSNYAFKGFYSEYIYIILPLISLLFFDKKIVHYIFLFISVLSFYVPNYLYNIYSEQSFGYLNVIFLFLGTFMIVNFFKNQNNNNEKALKKAYEELEETKKSELAHLQLKSLKAQMNPHFMFNAMNSIQNLVLKGDKHEAYQYLSKFSNMVRENLNMSEKSFVSFREELSLLKKYLELEKLRFKQDFEYKIIGIDINEDVKIPSMIIQPFLENAIKHGLLHKTNSTKKLKIEFVLEDVLKCIITDNGIGIKKSMEINKQNENESFSTNAINQRLEFLKDYYKTDIGFKYLPTHEGTIVAIKIPFFKN